MLSQQRLDFYKENGYLLVKFDDAPLEKGCIRVVPGSHKWGMLEHLPEGGWHLPFTQYPIASSVPCPAEAGDVLFFSYLTIHGSGINVSNEARTTLLVQCATHWTRRLSLSISHAARA